MADQDRERWTKLVADFEASDLTERRAGVALEREISQAAQRRRSEYVL